MAVYPTKNSVLRIDPIGLSNEDLELLSMEENPLHVLQYFISTNNDPPKFKAKIYEDIVDNYEFEKNDLENDGITCLRLGDSSSFLFINLLKNTAWAVDQLKLNKSVIRECVGRGLLNGIRSRNNKYQLIIPDDKFVNLLKTRENMVDSNVPSSNKKVVKIQDKVLSVIKSGVVGGKNDPINAETLLPYMASAYPNETFTKSKVTSTLGTLLSHGDLVRVNILDSNGNPTSKYAPGKYRINIRTAVDHPAVAHPIVNHPVVEHPNHPVVSAPVHPEPLKEVLRIAETSQEKYKMAGRIAFENYVRKHMKNDYLSFRVDQISKETPTVHKSLINTAINNLKRTKLGAELLKNNAPGCWEYRNNTDVQWKEKEIVEDSKTINDFIKQFADFQKVVVDLINKQKN